MHPEWQRIGEDSWACVIYLNAEEIFVEPSEANATPHRLILTFPSGKTEPIQDTRVSADIENVTTALSKARAVAVQAGDTVEKCRAQIEELQTALSQATSALAQAEANLSVAKHEVEKATATLEWAQAEEIRRKDAALQQHAAELQQLRAKQQEIEARNAELERQRVRQSMPAATMAVGIAQIAFPAEYDEPTYRHEERLPEPPSIPFP